MTPKERILERLAKMELVEGVLPTRPTRSPELAQVARNVRSDVRAAARTASDYFARTLPGIVLESATTLFSGSENLREQVAGFAEAGFGFFHASRELLSLSPSDRLARGGNGTVSRVLMANQRILMETSRVVVRFEGGTKESERADILKRHDLIDSGTGGLPPDTRKAILLKGTAVETSVAVMQEPGVAYAEPDFIEHIGRRHTPADPEFANQWHHANIQAEAAWDLTKGDGVTIAVIDNGFDKRHPDLLFGTLSGAFRPTPDQADADFVAGTGAIGDQDHGTACAGMIAAQSGNGSGGCGVAFSAALNMVACLGDQVGTQSTLARAVAYAARASLEDPAKPASVGADIIACSLGPNGAVWTMRQVLSDAIDFAATQGREGKGCAIFWACTNGNFPIGSDEVCSHAQVIAVGRSRRTDQDDASGFGPQLEFLAPGVDVRIPSSGGGYQVTTGTSFAAPCAAGVAALALSKNKALTAKELRQLMRDACDKVGNLPYIDGRNTRFGHGRVNAKRAVEEAVRLATGV
jgi:hypothetical protein